MRKYKAFTLAEILLVLAIIGVIAAVTIPATMQQSAEKKFAALAKKALSTMQNAIDLKLTYVPLKPNQMRMHLFQWLADGEQFGYDTLKVVDHTADWTRIQTADGAIWESHGQWPCTSCKLGIDDSFHIDLNGSEGPTKSTVQDGLVDYENDAKHYDVIWVEFNNQGQLVTNGIDPDGDAEDTRARKYFGYTN